LGGVAIYCALNTMPKEITLPLTAIEQCRLKECERTITDGERNFLEVAKALVEIRDKRLYRKDAKTFDEYVKKRWFKSSNWAFKMIKAAVVVEALPDNLCNAVPKKERVVRELSKVPEELRAAVIEKVVQNGEPVTSTTLKKAAAVIVPAKATKEEVVTDEFGWPIPPDAIPTWNRRQEVQDLLTQISRIKSVLEKAREENDALYMSELQWQTAWAAAKDLHWQIAHAKPAAVCLFCGGWAKTIKCAQCDGRGLISDKYWAHSQHPEMKQLKAMRLKEITKLKEKTK